jgi:hypothetical protein
MRIRVVLRFIRLVFLYAVCIKRGSPPETLPGQQKYNRDSFTMTLKPIISKGYNGHPVPDIALVGRPGNLSYICRKIDENEPDRRTPVEGDVAGSDARH